MNAFEAQARARKADLLQAWLIAAMSKMRGLTPLEAVDAAVRYCDNATPLAWEQMSNAVGVNTPSETTIAMLRERLVLQRSEMSKHPDDLFAGLAEVGW